MKLRILTGLFVATLALGVVTSLTGCGGGSGSPDAPVTRRYEGTWHGTYKTVTTLPEKASPMELTFTPDGKITGVLTPSVYLNDSVYRVRRIILDARMTGDNSFTGSLSERFGGATQDGTYSGASGTLRLEEGRLVGEFVSTSYHDFQLEKK